MVIEFPGARSPVVRPAVMRASEERSPGYVYALLVSLVFWAGLAALVAL
jgi:hypothetical protein